MPIKYVVQEMKRRNRETNLVDVSYFARPKYDGVTSQGDLAYLVSQISAVSVGDVLSVLNTTSMLMASELSNGRIVDMGDLGRFRLSIRSESAPQRELFVADNIRGNHVIYVPGPQIRRKLISPGYLRVTPGGVPVPLDPSGKGKSEEDKDKTGL